MAQQEDVESGPRPAPPSSSLTTRLGNLRRRRVAQVFLSLPPLIDFPPSRSPKRQIYLTWLSRLTLSLADSISLSPLCKSPPSRSPQRLSSLNRLSRLSLSISDSLRSILSPPSSQLGDWASLTSLSDQDLSQFLDESPGSSQASPGVSLSPIPDFSDFEALHPLPPWAPPRAIPAQSQSPPMDPLDGPFSFSLRSSPPSSQLDDGGSNASLSHEDISDESPGSSQAIPLMNPFSFTDPSQPSWDNEVPYHEFHQDWTQSGGSPYLNGYERIVGFDDSNRISSWDEEVYYQEFNRRWVRSGGLPYFKIYESVVGWGYNL